MERTIVVASFALLSAIGQLGCEDAKCTQMRACCSAIASETWVGDACGAMAETVRNPDSCRSILHAIEAAAEGGKRDLPEACR